MKYYRVKNFEKFQHYKDRNPPWIKLHRALLNDYEFGKLPDLAKSHLILIWLLASQLDGRIPDDPVWVRDQIGCKKPPDLGFLAAAGWLIPEATTERSTATTVEQNASTVLAPCKQDASNVLALARSREERTRTTETEAEESGAVSNGCPNSGHRDLAQTYGLDCAFEWGKYVDHEWKGKRPKDDVRGFRNWLHKAHEFAIRDGRTKTGTLDYGEVL